ncbi:MAG: RNA polymerase sigma factor [Flavobacteriaceae bacterium]|nr:RNA polymerase sigma factor [Flavobacteriaceae bacterium]
MIAETELIAKLKDPLTQDQAFRSLMSQYKERLYWHIRKIVISHDDADDVLQNTFIKVYRNINNFKAESKLYSWMYRIATNESITFINKRAKLNNVDLNDMRYKMAENLEADVHFEGDEMQLLLQKAIAKYFDDLKYQEISEILETSVGALKASYHHAVKKIELILTQ